MEGNTILNPNPLVKFLNKPQKEFTKADIIRYVTKNDIEMINFRYAGADGRLKTLNFIINSLEHLDSNFCKALGLVGIIIFSKSHNF